MALVENDFGSDILGSSTEGPRLLSRTYFLGETEVTLEKIKSTTTNASFSIV